MRVWRISAATQDAAASSQLVASCEATTKERWRRSYRLDERTDTSRVPPWSVQEGTLIGRTSHAVPVVVAGS
eukprot:6612315-Prymnesium_polylepis.1